MNAKKRKVAVAMSGGVDSSAAALILKEKGYEVIGVSMKLWEGSGAVKGKCCSLEDFQDARRVADLLDIPYYVVNMQEEFSKRVIERFTLDYMGGRTPNPCILCNQEMKFDLLLKKAKDLGAGCLATGHYARIEHDIRRGRYLLKKGEDKTKDQSYFLFSMTQKQLERVLFPLGGYCKEEVREILRRAGVRIADKEESQDICFVDDERGYSAFIEKSTGVEQIRRGNIVSPNGEVLGSHEGIHKFTIGQRRGLGIASKRRIYVVGFDYERNDVIVGDEDDLLAKGLTANNLNWISFEDLTGEMEASVKIRYSMEEYESLIKPLGKGKVRIEFKEPLRAVTPGQAVVFYSGDEVIGGGWIEEALN